jgi:GABA(A) receptor-associated protein
MKSKFHEEYSLERRKAECDRIMKKYHDRVPIIVQRGRSSQLPELKDRKFLVPRDFTMGQLLFVIRRRVKLSAEQGLFLFVNDTLPATNAMISQVYKEHHDEDGFLYCFISGESTFG